MSYQPEERYWTDYLRIALPVVGLLLMLGLFWFWAASLIRNGDSGKSPTPAGQAKAAVTTVAAAHPTPTSTPVVQITPTHQTSAVVTVPAQPATQPTQATQKQPTSTAAASTGNSTNSGTAAASGGSQQFNAGDVVNVTQDGVNMRDQPTTSGSQVVETLSQGTQLTILSGPTRADGYAWYQVEDVNQQKGYVAGQFLSK